MQCTETYFISKYFLKLNSLSGKSRWRENVEKEHTEHAKCISIIRNANEEGKFFKVGHSGHHTFFYTTGAQSLEKNEQNTFSLLNKTVPTNKTVHMAQKQEIPFDSTVIQECSSKKRIKKVPRFVILAAKTLDKGLAKLSLVDQIIVKSYYTLGRNKYEVRTESGDLLFSAKEEADGLVAWISGKERGFQFHFNDASNNKVISVIRPERIIGQSYKVQVLLGQTLVSIVRQKPTFRTSVLVINDARNFPVLRIKHFQLTTLAKESIGAVERLSFGFFKDLTSGGKFFRFTFPRDLSLEYKVACIGACVYIDFKYHS